MSDKQPLLDTSHKLFIDNDDNGNNKQLLTNRYDLINSQIRRERCHFSVYI